MCGCVHVRGRTFVCVFFFFFLMILGPPRFTQGRSSAASDVYKRQYRGALWEGIHTASSSAGVKLIVLSGYCIDSPNFYDAAHNIAYDLVPKIKPVSYTHLRAHETPEHLVCRLLLEKKKK